MPAVACASGVLFDSLVLPFLRHVMLKATALWTGRSHEFLVLSIENELEVKMQFGERGMMGSAIVAAFPVNYVMCLFVLLCLLH